MRFKTSIPAATLLLMCLAVLASAPAASAVSHSDTLQDHAYLFDGTADRAEDCVVAIMKPDHDVANDVCPKLDNGNPLSGMALGWYEVYVVIGAQRMQQLLLQGVDKATPDELAALDRATRSFLVAAEAGLAEAQFRYALMLSLRKPRATSLRDFQADTEYLEWMKKAADQDHAGAIHILGMRAYATALTSATVPADDEFLPYLERAAELGFEDARLMLQQYRLKATLPERAGDGDPQAQKEYAKNLFSEGRAFDRTELVEEALELIKAAADGGDVEALRLAGTWSWPQDPDAAEHYLLAAAAGQDSKAMISLGNLYACNGDEQASRRWFVAAQQLRHPEARYAIAELDEWGLDEWDCRII
ncbi:MAG: hypothetical protein R3358_08895 [Woeseiaceae bacterium]|nr:hypothetical protein [Woeseiaceae bacterium]